MPFDLPERDVRHTLANVYWLQAAFMLTAGVIALVMPRRRFGPSYHFITAVPAGQYILAAVYIGCALFMAYSLVTHDQRRMGYAMLTAAFSNCVLALFVFAGATQSPTGVFSPIFCMAIGIHMFLHAAMLNRR